MQDFVLSYKTYCPKTKFLLWCKLNYMPQRICRDSKKESARARAPLPQRSPPEQNPSLPEQEELTMKRCLFSLLLTGAMLLSMCPPGLAAADVEYRYCDANGQSWQTGTKTSGEYAAVTASDTA